MPSYPASTPDSGGKVDLIIIRSRPYNNKVKRAVPDPHQLQHLGKNSPVPCMDIIRKSVQLARGKVSQP